MTEPIDSRSARQRIRELEADLPDDYEICPKCGRTRDGAAGRIRELEAELAEWRQFREKMFVANSEGAFNVIYALRDSLRASKARAEKAEAFVNEWNEHPLRSRRHEGGLSEKEMLGWYRGRVRELEQALDEAPSRDRLNELEAELAQLRDSKQGWEALIANAKARAEKAEARVAELERRLRDHHPSDRAQENCLVCCGEEAREREAK